MKSYSLSEIVYIDSPTLSALIGNHIAYSKQTVILAQAELKRRGEFTDQLKESIDNFCISNKISQLDDAFYSVLEANDIAQSEWVQMGRDITPKTIQLILLLPLFLKIEIIIIIIIIIIILN